ASGSVTGLGAAVTLATRAGSSLMAGGDIRYTSATVGTNGIVLSDRQQFNGGGQAELDAPISWFGQVNVHGDLNEQWSESPITIQEGGVTTGTTGHLFLFPRDRRLLLDAGAQLRRLSLAPREGDLTPRANQTLLFIGGDVVLWSSPARLLRGEVMDDRMV